MAEHAPLEVGTGSALAVEAVGLDLAQQVRERLDLSGEVRVVQTRQVRLRFFKRLLTEEDEIVLLWGCGPVALSYALDLGSAEGAGVLLATPDREALHAAGSRAGSTR